MRKITIFLLFCITIWAHSEPFSYDPFTAGDDVIKQYLSKANGAGFDARRGNAIVLGAIMSNRAFLNGKWYSVGDRFGPFRVSMIRPTMVGLRKDHKTKIYHLGKKKRVLTIKERL